MSVVGDLVWGINTQLNAISRAQDPFIVGDDDEEGSLQEQGLLVAAALERQEISERLRTVKSLSMASSSAPMLPTWRIERELNRSGLVMDEEDRLDSSKATEPQSPFELETEWLLVAKVAMQMYGTVLQTLIDQHTSLDQHLSYWDDVSNSQRYGLVYCVQQSPIRLWGFSKEVYLESKLRMERLYSSESSSSSDSSRSSGSSGSSDEGATSRSSLSLTQRWGRFYQIVWATVQDRSLSNIQSKILSPIALCQADARDKHYSLQRLKENLACGIGALVDELLNFSRDDWKDDLERSVSLMDAILPRTGDIEGHIGEFEDEILNTTQQDLDRMNSSDSDNPVSPALRPRRLAVRLLKILQTQLPTQIADTESTLSLYGRPSRLVRYWLPATVGLLSSTTLLRFLVNRKAEVIQWITEIGITVRDFWTNWVVDPVRKVIGTIRHDETSEIALMSRDSLRADLESLERMVVDFVVDKPHFAAGDAKPTISALSETQITEIRAKVSQGDVTPVLKAYEKDLKSPLMGAVRGDLVRSLLIQVQKSKVDMEVALSGIDALLKSQELVFGFVGLTPGILVSAFVVQYFHGIFMGRSGFKKRERAGKATTAIRTVGRMLAKADLRNEDKRLSYEQIGTLYCQAHILRTVVPRMMPRDTERDFLADLNELVRLRAVSYQKTVLDDMAFTYQKWIL